MHTLTEVEWVHFTESILPHYREIGRMDSRDLNKDTSGTRAFATFLLELVEKIPELMLPSISVLVGLLDGEVRAGCVCVCVWI